MSNDVREVAVRAQERAEGPDRGTSRSRSGKAVGPRGPGFAPGMPSSVLMALQRTAGNAVVASLLGQAVEVQRVVGEFGGHNLRSSVGTTSASGAGDGDGGGRRPWRREGTGHQADFTGYGPEAEKLMAYGERWYRLRAKRETGQPLTEEEQQTFSDELALFNELLKGENMALRPSRNSPFEPFVARLGQKLRPYARDTYENFVAHVAGQDDGGAHAARQLVEWAAGRVLLSGLPQSLRDFAVITHLAEVARGYGELVRGFDRMALTIADMTDPARARETWNRLVAPIEDGTGAGTWFWPALTQINADGRGHRYEPEDGGPESDSEPDAEISDGELEDLVHDQRSPQG